MASARTLIESHHKGSRCEGITAAGEQCKCWSVCFVNGIPYCREHAQKELALAAKPTEKKV